MPGRDCGNCDNCLTPAAAWDATVPAQKALSCAYRSGQRFGAAHLIDILRGSDNEKIRGAGHDQLSTWGIGKDLTSATWRSVFRQLVAAGLLEVDAEGYGSLRLTEASRDVLAGKRTLMLRRESPAARTASDERRRTGSAATVPTEDAGVFGALRELRAGWRASRTCRPMSSSTTARCAKSPRVGRKHRRPGRPARHRPRQAGPLRRAGGRGGGRRRLSPCSRHSSRRR
jgi:superfamily II DNA helicase RecQ